MEKSMDQKNLMWRVAVKYAIILSLISIFMSIIQTITFNPDLRALSNMFTILDWIIFIVFLGLAHIEFNGKNSNFISFKDAILIGLIIVAIYFVVTSIVYIVNYELFLKEKMQAWLQTKLPEGGTSDYFNTGFARRTLDYLFGNFIISVVGILVLFLIITWESHWKIFKKAGKKGWHCLIPIYNTIVFFRICHKPAWWIILLLIPFVDLIIIILAYNNLSKAYGKTGGFTAGLFFFPFIFFPKLGLSHLKYEPSLIVKPQ